MLLKQMSHKAMVVLRSAVELHHGSRVNVNLRQWMLEVEVQEDRLGEALTLFILNADDLKEVNSF